jgi:hypothetical protein
VHNCSAQTICMLCPSLAAVCAVVTCRVCVWPEQALMRPCDTCAACNMFKSYPDDEPAESKHGAVAMFCKTVVFDHYLFIYLFIPLFIVQTQNWMRNFKTGCVCASAFCCGPAFIG